MRVSINQGILNGHHCKTRFSNKPYVRFLGIPYAKPPINDFRFKPPEEHPGWPGVLEANSEGNMCMQYSLKKQKVIGSEDCLYLNICVPQEDLNVRKSVMAFIHGGIFSYGSGSLNNHSPDYLLDENVIVVTFNYRLNILGFLNFDIDDCPGNMGLKDQLFALKWIKSNISAFGGDADNITIFGQSAGSASINYHMLSPQSTGLFKRAIMQSGGVFNPWACNTTHRETAFNLAKVMGCHKTDPKEVVEYLRNVPATDLVQNFRFEKEKKDYQFVPSIESDAVSNRFLPVHPDILAKTATPIPIIAGINNMEGIMLFEENNMEKYLLDFPTPEEFKFIFGNTCSEKVIDEIKKFYFDGNNLNSEVVRLENMCHFYSDFYFIKDFYRSFNHILEQGDVPVYNYEFKFDGELNGLKNMLLCNRPILRKSLKGACHADELGYLFHGKLSGNGPESNSSEMKMCRLMSKLWCNFAKTGNPNSPEFNFTWDNTNKNDPKYLSLDGDNTCMVNELLYGSRVNFWKNKPL